ncbi:hypothetical protein CJ030_MR1G018135 [Morella rubra]|uniref:RNase H type-1 domain-containing protein n=1 Tax=Morella rubra TaxID=262757 RepID=A0A6A1WPK5_9ROSI|nr:hypothetical protein CJ030_MR1G018135 [Morella rubra]
MGLCRDHEGSILLVRTSTISAVQLFWDEIKAALMACRMAEDAQWLSVYFEGDALNACSAIIQNGKDVEGYLVADCKVCHDILSLHPNWNLTWVPRKRNCLAHKIAKWAVQTRRSGSIAAADIPPFILNCDWLYKPP